MMSVFHTERFTIAQSPETIARNILDPDRVMDYFPGAIAGGKSDDDTAIWIRSKTGTTLIERLSAADDTSHVTVRVTSTQLKTNPPNLEVLAQSPLMRFTEDWVLNDDPSGTSVTKTWGNLETFGFMRFMPARWLVTRSGRAGAKVIAAKWASPSS